MKRREKSIGTRLHNSDYWKKRAEHYNELMWAKDGAYLDAFVKACKLKKTEVVLDVGTGTGIVAHAIAPLVQEVIGLDKSQAMLEHSNWRGNMYFIRRNILTPIFKDEVFDKVVARHVFHHILVGRQRAMNECYRVLKRGGLMVFSEGVPPCPEVKRDYIEIFKLKEKRRTFLEEDIVDLMKKAGFQNIQVSIFMLKSMSVRSWLVNSDVPESTQEQILDLHANAGDYFKKAYNMVQVAGDCFIDVKMAIVTGEKQSGNC